MWRKNQESKPSSDVSSAAAAVPTQAESSNPEQAKTEIAEVAAPVVAASAPVSQPVSAPPPQPSPVYASAQAPAAPVAGDESRISSGLKIRGEITGTSDMYIDGDVQGKVRVGSGRLTVGASGRVQADLEAREIFVLGSVQGNLKATDRVQVGSSGSVEGSVTTSRIGIEDGARVRGKVETGQGVGQSSSQTTESQRPAARASEKVAVRAAAAQGAGE